MTSAADEAAPLPQTGGGGAADGDGDVAGGGAGAEGGGGGGDGGGGVESEALLRSTRVRLNGALLGVDASGVLPKLPKLHSVRMRGPTIIARPLSVAFHVFPEAGVRACMSEKQEAAWQKKERKKDKRAGKGKVKLPKGPAAGAKPGLHKKSEPEDAADAAGCTGDPEWCQNQRRKAAVVPR